MNDRRGRIFASIGYGLHGAALFASIAWIAGWATAALSLLLLLSCHGAGRALIPRAWEKKHLRSPAIFYCRILFGLGLFSFAWTVCGLAVAGRIRVFLAFAMVAIAAIVIAWKRWNRPGETQLPDAKTPPIYWILPLLVILVTSFPFRHIGKPTPQGYAYRAYFSSDYLKQYSLIQTLSQHKLPPQNPYFQGEKLHYYWMFFAFPSSLYALTGDAQNSMLAFSATVNLLLMGLLFWALWGAVKRNGGNVFVSLFMGFIPVLFLSLEGIYLIFHRLRGIPLSLRLLQARGFNIDALTRWLWDTPQIDSLLRTLLYMPQAGISCAFFVLYLWSRKEEEAPFALGIFSLVFSLSANLLIGMGFLLFFSCDMLYQAFAHIRDKGSWKVPARRFAFLGLSIVASLLVFYFLGILSTGVRGFYVQWIPGKEWLPFLLLNLGFLLMFGGIGSMALAKKEPYLLASIVLLSIVCSVRIQGFESDVPLKFSLVLMILLLFPLQELLIKAKSKSRYLLALLLFPFLLCLPTALIDEINSSDIRNLRFTYFLPREEQRLLIMANQQLPLDAVIQDYPLARPEGISIIPTFMARRTLVGDSLHSRLFLIPEGKYQERIALVRRCFADLETGRNELLMNGIDYVLWGEAEKKAFGYTPRLPVKLRSNDTLLFSLR